MPERFIVAVTYDPKVGYRTTGGPELPVVSALSLGGIRRRVEALMCRMTYTSCCSSTALPGWSGIGGGEVVWAGPTILPGAVDCGAGSSFPAAGCPGGMALMGRTPGQSRRRGGVRRLSSHPDPSLKLTLPWCGPRGPPFHPRRSPRNAPAALFPARA
jgi:hypothetical protein